MNNLALPFTVFLKEILLFIGGVGLLFRDVVRELFKGRFYWRLEATAPENLLPAVSSLGLAWKKPT